MTTRSYRKSYRKGRARTAARMPLESQVRARRVAMLELACVFRRFTLHYLVTVGIDTALRREAVADCHQRAVAALRAAQELA